MLTLGTAQFGLNYGINNNIGIPSNEEIKKILNLCIQNQVEYVDTAQDYGDAQKKLGRYNLEKFKIISKIKNIDSLEDLIFKYEQILKELNVSNIYGLLIHSTSEIMNNERVWHYLQNLKKNQTNLKIGYSIYTVEEMLVLLDKNFIPDIIQIPYNIFDREFEPHFKMLNDLNINVFVRSVFLQGLFFMKSSQIPYKLSKLKPKLYELNRICDKYSISISEAAIGFVIRNNNITGIITGVESSSQFMSNINLMENSLSTECINELSKISTNKFEPLSKPNMWNYE